MENYIETMADRNGWKKSVIIFQKLLLTSCACVSECMSVLYVHVCMCAGRCFSFYTILMCFTVPLMKPFVFKPFSHLKNGTGLRFHFRPVICYFQSSNKGILSREYMVKSKTFSTFCSFFFFFFSFFFVVTATVCRRPHHCF